VARFVEGSAVLAQEILGTIWSELCGNTNKANMWWSDGLDQINDDLKESQLSPVSSLGELATTLVVWQVIFGRCHENSIEVCLSPDWEEEHGLGVLVAGKRVIGMGSEGNVEPWDEDEPWPPWEGGPVRNPFTGQLIDPRTKKPIE